MMFEMLTCYQWPWQSQHGWRLKSTLATLVSPLNDCWKGSSEPVSMCKRVPAMIILFRKYSVRLCQSNAHARADVMSLNYLRRRIVESGTVAHPGRRRNECTHPSTSYPRPILTPPCLSPINHQIA